MSAQETDVRVTPGAGTRLDGSVARLYAGVSAKVAGALYSQQQESEETISLGELASSNPPLLPPPPSSSSSLEHYDTIPLMGGVPALSDVEDRPEAYIVIPLTSSTGKRDITEDTLSSSSSSSSSVSSGWDPRSESPIQGQQFQETGEHNAPPPPQEEGRGSEGENTERVRIYHEIRASVDEEEGKTVQREVEKEDEERRQTTASATQIIAGQRRSYNCAAALLIVVLYAGAFL